MSRAEESGSSSRVFLELCGFEKTKKQKSPCPPYLFLFYRCPYQFPETGPAQEVTVSKSKARPKIVLILLFMTQDKPRAQSQHLGRGNYQPPVTVFSAK